MGEEFWWFYDVIAVAVVMVSVFISAKKGVMKAILSLSAYAVAFVMAISLSSSLSGSLYKGTIRNSNIKKLDKTLSSVNYSLKMGTYLESLGYNVRVKIDYLDKIFKSGKNYDEQIYKYLNNINNKKVDNETVFYDKLHDGYASLIHEIISENLSIYSAEYAAREIKEHPQKMEELIPLMLDIEDKIPAAKYIADNYIETPYKNTVRLTCFVLLLAVFLIVSLFVLRSLTDERIGYQSIASHITGGIFGVFKGAVLVFGIAVMVRLYVILGSDKMLFFNFKAIDKTYIFKYVYNFIMNNM
ncbi:MAG: hypothetical protein J6L05_00840 [Ruminococcus sp.]|nr:hypothetical protein [Ruminococcus sp.]